MHALARTLARYCGIVLGMAVLVCQAALGTPVGGYRAEYAGYSHGFLVLRLEGSVNFTGDGYDLHVTFHTAGLPGLAVRVDSDSRAQGRFSGGAAQPSLFETSGHLHGTARLTRIFYAEGSPVIQVRTPLVPEERSAVPVAETRHTIDTLSAAALLIRQVSEGARCEGQATTFDGWRLGTQAVYAAGWEKLEPTVRSIFAGPAQRCDIEGRQLAGFVRNESEDELRRPRHGTVWLADMLPAAPPVPVRMVFENRLLGRITLCLTKLTAAEVPGHSFPPGEALSRR